MKKILSVALVLFAVLTASCAMESEISTDSAIDLPAGFSFDTEGFGEGTMVKLFYAKSVMHPEHQLKGNIVGYVAVKDVAYHKEVVCHYSFDGQNTWNDAYGEYVMELNDGWELWKFETVYADANPRTGFDVDFAVRYSVNGVDYWDNNGEEDYGVGYGPRKIYSDMEFGQSEIALYDSDLLIFDWRTLFRGQVYIEDYHSTGTMELVYSLDNWQSVEVMRLGRNYYENSYNWAIEVPEGTEEIDFALVYEKDGVEYWDNNFGRDYTVNAEEFAPIPW